MRLSQTILVCFNLLLVSCSKEPVAPSLSPGGPKLLALYPSQTVAGVGFNVQPGGVAALALGCSNLTIGKVSVVFATKSLPTAASFENNGCVLSIAVPKELYSTPGSYPVYIQDSAGESNHLTFVVKPAQ